jgi:hypothetical protein
VPQWSWQSWGCAAQLAGCPYACKQSTSHVKVSM